MSKPVNRRAKGVNGVVSAKKENAHIAEMPPQQSDRIIRIDDEESFHRLVANESAALKDYIRQWLPNIQDVEEAAQNTFMYMWENRESLSFKTMNMLYRYLNTAAKSYALNILREQKMQQKFYNHRFHASVDYADAPDDIYMSKQNDERLTQIIKKMPEMRAKVFTMSFSEGKSDDVIARSLNISPVTVRRHLSLAREDIRKYLNATH